MISAGILLKKLADEYNLAILVSTFISLLLELVAGLIYLEASPFFFLAPCVLPSKRQGALIYSGRFQVKNEYR